MPAVGKRKWRLLSVAIGAALIAVSAGAIGLWLARSRVVDDPATRAVHAYKSGQWTIAADLARQILSQKKDDQSAYGSWPGHRLGSVGPTSRWPSISAASMKRISRADDHLSLGLLFQRKGRKDLAARVEESDRGDRGFTSALEEICRLSVQARRWEEAILAADRLRLQPDWEAPASVMLGTIRVELNNLGDAAQLFHRARTRSGSHRQIS